MSRGINRQNIPLTFMIVGILALGAVFFIPKAPQKKAAAVTKASLKEDLISQSRNQELQKFNLTGFDEKGKSSWNLQGDAAKIEPGETVHLDQNVTLRLQDSTVVRSDHVQWSQSTGVLKTSSPVYVDHQNAKVKGIGALGRLNDSFLQLNRQIEMVLNQTTRLTCDGPLKIFYKDNKMSFYRKVRITDEKGTLSANRMDVFFDPVAKKAKEIVGMGNVIITRGQDQTKSQRVFYTVATGAVRLEGNPEITLHSDSASKLDATFRN